MKREEAFMSNNLTLSPDFMIRSPQTSTEIEEFFRLNAQVFRSDENTDYIRLSKDVFTQLIFGFRSVTWAIIQPGQQIPVELIPILNVLFPRCEGRIAGSDFF